MEKLFSNTCVYSRGCGKLALVLCYIIYHGIISILYSKSIKVLSLPVKHIIIEWVIPLFTSNTFSQHGQVWSGSILERVSASQFLHNAVGHRRKASPNCALYSNQALRRLWSCLLHISQVSSCLQTLSSKSVSSAVRIHKHAYLAFTFLHFTQLNFCSILHIHHYSTWHCPYKLDKSKEKKRINILIAALSRTIYNWTYAK